MNYKHFGSIKSLLLKQKAGILPLVKINIKRLCLLFFTEIIKLTNNIIRVTTKYVFGVNNISSDGIELSDNG